MEQKKKCCMKFCSALRALAHWDEVGNGKGLHTDFTFGEVCLQQHYGLMFILIIL